MEKNKNQAESKQAMYKRADDKAENKSENSVPNRAHTEMKKQSQNKKNNTNCR